VASEVQTRHDRETGIFAFGKLLRNDVDVSDALREMRNRVINEYDAAVLGVPKIMRFELSNDEVIELLIQSLLGMPNHVYLHLMSWPNTFG
jgi:hypothetical protein